MRRLANNTIAQDPRIDSPDVKVIYPSDETPMVEKSATVTERAQVQTQLEQPTQQEVTQPQTQTTEQHTCTLSLMDAIKQHQTAVILSALGLLLIGFLIGKNKAL